MDDNSDNDGLSLEPLTCDEPETAAQPDGGDERTPADPEARTSRRAAKVVAAFETAEGDGARVRRSIGTPGLWNLSPFLILDHARVGRGEGGFPDHPHRGMATVTYVLEGKMQHEDFLGHADHLGPGDMQWMTAGRGMVHSEMPLWDDDEDSRGGGKGQDAVVALQLWIDLPAAKKMVKPSYVNRRAAQIPRAEFDGGSVAVLAGESQGVRAAPPRTGGCWLFDFTLFPGGQVWQPLPPGWTAFIYVVDGAVAVGEEDTAPKRIDGGKNTPQWGKKKSGKDGARSYDCLVLTSAPSETGVLIRNAAKAHTRFILAAGESLDQQVVQQGPFVLTSRDAAAQALKDYQSGRNGFEKALGWRSKSGSKGGLQSSGRRGKR